MSKWYVLLAITTWKALLNNAKIRSSLKFLLVRYMNLFFTCHSEHPHQDANVPPCKHHILAVRLPAGLARGPQTHAQDQQVEDNDSYDPHHIDCHPYTVWGVRELLVRGQLLKVGNQLRGELSEMKKQNILILQVEM